MANAQKSRHPFGRKHTVFLSHSGQLSHDLAGIFRKFLRIVLSPLEPFLSDESILLGNRWAPNLDEKLGEAEFGIFFVTKANAYSSPWMLYEAGAIAAVHKDIKRIVPILIDIPDTELPAVYGAFQWMRFSQERCRSLVAQLKEGCSDLNSLASDVVDTNFKREWPKLQKDWERRVAASKTEAVKVEELARVSRVGGDKVQQYLLDEISQVRSVVFDDEKFYNWTYALHNVIHTAREACVKMVGDRVRNDRLPPSTEPGSIPSPHPGMELFASEIREILDNIRELFEKLPETADCNIRVCLRDLRSDGNFYTYSRSVPTRIRNPNLDNKSTPIPKDCFAFKLLEETWIKAKCVIETTPEKGWNGKSKKHLNDAFYKTKTVLVASVIAKEVKRNVITNAYTIWAIFVSSDKDNVFRPYHHAILQACNDAFSCMANLMLRKDSIPKKN